MGKVLETIQTDLAEQRTQAEAVGYNNKKYTSVNNLELSEPVVSAYYVEHDKSEDDYRAYYSTAIFLVHHNHEIPFIQLLRIFSKLLKENWVQKDRSYAETFSDNIYPEKFELKTPIQLNYMLNYQVDKVFVVDFNSETNDFDFEEIYNSNKSKIDFNEQDNRVTKTLFAKFEEKQHEEFVNGLVNQLKKLPPDILKDIL